MTEIRDVPENSRTIVLLDDVKNVGKSGERTRVTATQAKALIKGKKARMATMADFGLKAA